MQQGHDIPGVSVGLVEDSVFEWEVMLMMSDDCKYYGGVSIPSSLLNTDRLNNLQEASSEPDCPSRATIQCCHQR